MMQHRHEHDDDAIFSKKPLEGVSCASCEKDLVNLYGKAADYHHWNRMPSRDPSERIARVGWFVGWLSPRSPLQIGQGFSRLLSSIRVDYANKTNKLASPGSQPNMHFYETEEAAGGGGGAPGMNQTYSAKMYHQQQHNGNPRAVGRPKTAGKVKTGHNMINSPSGDVGYAPDQRWAQH